MVYIKSLQEDKAKRFKDICSFYVVVKKNKLLPTVKLIMILSIIEKIISIEKEWKEFPSWVSTQKSLIQQYIDDVTKDDVTKNNETKKMDEETFRVIIERLKDKYYELYGSQRNVFEFFKNYVSSENQRKLIHGFMKYEQWINIDSNENMKRYKQLESKGKPIKKISEELGLQLEAGFVFHCFDWKKCPPLKCGCSLHYQTCELINNESTLEKALKEVVKDIYQVRSDFVHSALITELPEIEESEKDRVFAMNFGVIGSKKKFVLIQIPIGEFESIFEQAIKKYLVVS